LPPDGEQRLEVGGVGLLHRDRRVEAACRQLGVAALDEHAFLARVQQRLHAVGADETQPAGDQDHVGHFRPLC